jgi:hypothetical protein
VHKACQRAADRRSPVEAGNHLFGFSDAQNTRQRLLNISMSESMGRISEAWLSAGMAKVDGKAVLEEIGRISAQDQQTLTDSLILLARMQSDAISQLGARMAVTSEFLWSVLEHRSLESCEEIARNFRSRVEDLMAKGDDHVLPAAYNDALLDEINRYLKALSR